jgi:hypothetical protein
MTFVKHEAHKIWHWLNMRRKECGIPLTWGTILVTTEQDFDNWYTQHKYVPLLYR